MSRSFHAHRFSPITRAPEVRPTLDAVVRAYRPRLLAAARRHLRRYAQCPDEVVQDVCLSVLEGHITLAADPSRAFERLLTEIIVRCRTLRRIEARRAEHRPTPETTD